MVEKSKRLNVLNIAGGVQPMQDYDQLYFMNSALPSHGRVLADLGEALSAGEIWDRSDLQAILRRQPNALILLFYEAPDRAVMRAMSAGELPSAALKHWIAQARDQLALLQGHPRGRLRLYSLEAVLADPAELAAGLNLPSESVAHVETEASDGVEADALLQALALQMLQKSDVARKLLVELEALAVPMTGAAGPEADPDAAFSYYQSARDGYEASHGEIARARADRSVLQQQLFRLQAELERQYRDRHHLAQDRQTDQRAPAGADARLASLQDEADRLRGQEQERTDRIARLEASLADSQAARDRTEAELKTLQDSLAATRQRDGDSAAQIQDLTDRLAAGQAALEAARKEAEAAQHRLDEQSAESLRQQAEHELFLRKLNELQVELEEQYRKRNALEVEVAEKARLEQRLHQTQQGVRSYETQLADARRRTESAETALSTARSLSETRRQAIFNKNEKISALEQKKAQLTEAHEKTAEGSRQRKWEIRRLERETEKLKADLGKLRARLKEIEASRGYRVLQRLRRMWPGRKAQG